MTTLRAAARAVAAVLPAWRSIERFDEEVDVDSPRRSPACSFVHEDALCVRVIDLHDLDLDGGIAVTTGVLVRDVCFSSAEVSALSRASDCVARNRIDEVTRRRYRSRDLDALVADVRDQVVPWFARIVDARSLIDILRDGGEHDRWTAALLCVRERQPGAEHDLRALYEASAASVAWKDVYRASAARFGVALPQAIEPPLPKPAKPEPRPRRVRHPLFGDGTVIREVRDGSGRKLLSLCA